jgi:hypothetical protein
MKTFAVAGVTVLLLVAEVPSTSVGAGATTARAIVARWRSAVRPADTARAYGAVTTFATTREIGLDGKLVIVVTPDGHYHQRADRAGDITEVVLTPQNGWLKDWNGDVRVLQGDELKRERAEAFVAAAIAFGPPAILDRATVGSDPENKFDVLKFASPAMAATTWFLDRATGLPAKVERPSDDGTLTIAFNNWPKDGTQLMPRATTETGGEHKSALITTMTAIVYAPKLGGPVFTRPKVGASDVHFTTGTAALHIPFNFENNHIMVDGSVNGHGPLWWLLDTGAGQSLVDSDRVADLGLTPYGSSSVTGGGGAADYAFVKGATFTFPGVELRNQHAGKLGIAGLEKIYGMEMGGLLGYDFFSRFVVVFDYTAKTMDLYDPAGFHYSGPGTVVPFTIENGLLYTDGTISVPTEPNIPAHFIIDTGAADTMNLSSPFVKKYRLTEVAQTVAGVNRTPGAADFYTQTNVRGLLQNIHLGGVTLENVPVNFSVSTSGAYSASDFAGTIGEGILHRYRVIFDYSRRKMILEPTAETVKPFPERRTFGMTLLSSGPHYKTFTVSAVRTGSPAEKAGFRVSDIIAAIDGRSASALTLGEVRDDITHDGQHFTFTVTRGAESVDIPTTITLVSIDRAP